MSENYSFRSSMNGFNRNDVIAFIDELIAEKISIEEKLAELEREVAEIRSENETLRGIIVEQSEREESTEKCSECDIAKKYEARLGAAMLDAKRFSEILVKEANDKSAAVFANAFDVASATTQKAQGITQSITDISKQFSVSFRTLIENMTIITKTLEAFQGDVKSSGNAFSYNTDFSENAASDVVSLHTSSVTANSSRIKGAPDVNFDDADEFDIRVDVDV